MIDEKEEYLNEMVMDMVNVVAYIDNGGAGPDKNVAIRIMNDVKFITNFKECITPLDDFYVKSEHPKL